uniref:Uncharacterized protein TCIL3000_10_8620 n=1 Tax=Trypanosoma congolense (strain IL3000) TaxID=1068625 RepID=G0UXG9_TRYCI|nr:unnamed protein product [Trypanosoma congolense IL3000]
MWHHTKEAYFQRDLSSPNTWQMAGAVHAPSVLPKALVMKSEDDLANDVPCDDCGVAVFSNAVAGGLGPCSLSHCGATDLRLLEEVDEENQCSLPQHPCFLLNDEITNEMEENVKYTPWFTPAHTHRLLDEVDSTDHSVTCPGLLATVTVAQDHRDPGAPTKGQASRVRIFHEEEELTIPFPRVPQFSNMCSLNADDDLRGSGDGALTPCGSSNLSRITPLEEGGESVDLANHITRLVIGTSPTPKKLDFVTPLEDVGVTGRVNVGAENVCGKDYNPCSSSEPPGFTRRNKRFLEDLDLNVSAQPFNPSSAKVDFGTPRKCRRVDMAGGRGGEQRQHMTGCLKL